MAGAWGSSFGVSWGNAWGGSSPPPPPPVVTVMGGGGTEKPRRYNRIMYGVPTADLIAEDEVVVLAIARALEEGFFDDEV